MQLRSSTILLSLAAASSLLSGVRPAPAPSRVPVVVELFTSEGCSSCPAADAVLRELEATQPVPGAEIIALGQHVDYWNRLGWEDPFSAPQFTARQQQYATQFNSGSYTPQTVVNGRYELVGSRQQQLVATVAKAAHALPASVQLSNTAGVLHVRVAGVPTGTAATVLAFTETGLATQVGRGENAGQLLRHAAVVRELRSLGAVAADGTFSATPALAPSPQWKTDHLRAVVLVQADASRRIVGAASLLLGAGNP